MKQIRVLILDDEFEVVEMTSSIVEDLGYFCAFKTDSPSALEYCRKEPVDIVLLDIDLKEPQTGIDLIPQFKAVRPDMLVLMFTGEYKVNVAVRAMQAGAFDYVLKPIDPAFLEARLRIAVAKIKSDALMKTYFHTIVHDFKYPVSTLNLTLDSMGVLPACASDKTLQTLVELGKRQVQILYKMITSTLVIDKFQHQPGDLEHKNFRLQSCLDELLTIFNPVLSTHQRVVARNSLPEDYTVETDPDVFGHVLLNLVSNAIKHSPVQTPVEVGLVFDKGRVRVHVTNQGTYIAPADRERIFDKYYQIKDCVPSESKASFGLGLSFCKAAVECLGGEIWVDSTPTPVAETTFYFTVPAPAAR